MEGSNRWNARRLSAVLIVLSILAQTATSVLFIAKTNYDILKQGDTGQYVQIADNVIAGHGYSIDRGSPWRPTAGRAPGMLITNIPFRALFSWHPWLVVIPGHLIPLIAAFFCMHAGRMIAENEWGCFAGPIATLIPTTAYYGVNPYASGPVYFLAFSWILWALAYSMRGWRYGFLILAAASCYAMSLRPAAIVPLAAAALSCFGCLLFFREQGLRRRLLVSGLAIIAGTAAIYLPWSYRNYREFGTFSYSSIYGHILLNSAADGMRTALDKESAIDLRSTRADHGTRVNSRSEGDQLAIAGQQSTAAVGLLKRHALAFVKTHLAGSLTAFLYFRAKEIQVFGGKLLPYALEAWQGLLTAAALLGCVWYLREGTARFKAVLLIAGAAGLASVLTAGVMAKPKFRIPLEPVVAVGSAIFLTRALRRTGVDVLSDRLIDHESPPLDWAAAAFQATSKPLQNRSESS